MGCGKQNVTGPERTRLPARRARRQRNAPHTSATLRAAPSPAEPELIGHHFSVAARRTRRYDNDVMRRVRTATVVDARPTRAPRQDFSALVRAAPESPVALPLTHVTDGYSFRDIMGRGALLPSPCRIFGGELIYLFYGRPAYRTTVERESNGSDAYWPVCFVMQPGVAAATRIYPFDSGAFHHGRFDEFMYHSMIKEDFELEADPTTPGRLLRLFWDDEKAYYNAEEVRPFPVGALDFEAKAYQELIRHRGRGPFDERNSAIEIQVSIPIELRNNTLAIILPHVFATADMIAKIESFGALALPFDVVRRHGPIEMVGQIYTVVRDLLGGRYGSGRGRCW